MVIIYSNFQGQPGQIWKPTRLRSLSPRDVLSFFPIPPFGSLCRHARTILKKPKPEQEAAKPTKPKAKAAKKGDEEPEQKEEEVKPKPKKVKKT